MNRLIEERSRTHRCGDLRKSDIGQEVVLMGWVQNRRDHGGCVFIDLRDRTGLVQVMFDRDSSADAHALAGELRLEFVLGIVGKVRSRGDQVNDRLATGAIEIVATHLEIFNRAETPPFPIEDNIGTAEHTRLKYRFLDLRRTPLTENFRRRHLMNQVVRRVLSEQGFWELETPFLIRTTPEGARDFVVPSRVAPGSFYALPQSPQLFKQLFMVSGYDRYFQIARCFRDEDLRADRQPEFTQIDLEMSFIKEDDVMLVVENLIASIWREVAQREIPLPLPRMTYDHAMAKYGIDAPDARFAMLLEELTDVVKGSQFQAFNSVVEAGGIVKAMNVKGGAAMSRKELDDLNPVVAPFKAKIAWIKVNADGWQGPIAKFFDDDRKARIAKQLGAEVGDLLIFCADRAKACNAAMGTLREHLGAVRKLYDQKDLAFCWVTDFPMYEYNEEDKRHYAAHHPFTSPKPEDVDKLLTDPGKVKARAYDIVLNGNEIGGGSIRIHRRDVQDKVFQSLGLSTEESTKKFGFLLDALSYGAPPHGGLALGVDRILMLLCGTDNIRDVIAFPKTQSQSDLMLDAPSPLDGPQLEELNLRVVKPAPKG